MDSNKNVVIRSFKNREQSVRKLDNLGREISQSGGKLAMPLSASKNIPRFIFVYIKGNNLGQTIQRLFSTDFIPGVKNKGKRTLNSNTLNYTDNQITAYYKPKLLKTNGKRVASAGTPKKLFYISHTRQRLLLMWHTLRTPERTYFSRR